MRKEHISDEEWAQVNEFNSMILDDFLCNSAELSPKTRGAYASNLKVWFKWVKDNLKNKSQLNITPLDYKKFQNWMINRGCSSADINNKRAAISSLNGYIEIYYHDEYPTFRNFINKSIKRPPKSVVNEKAPLTKEEFNHLIDVLTEMGEWQKVAYLVFTLDTGCRRAESRQLLKDVVNARPIKHTKTVDKEDGTQEIKEATFYQTHTIRCKGAGTIGKVRKFTFGEQTMEALKKWLSVRGEDNCPYMFVTTYGGEARQVSETLFNTWATNLFSKIVGRRVHPHQMRSSRATQLVVEDGVNIRVVQKLLGHENESTTAGYVVRDDTEDLDELYISSTD